VFRKIGQRILLPGISDSSSTSSSLVRFPDEELKRLSDHRLVPSWVLVTLEIECAEFCATYPDARTWRDMQLHADERFRIFDEPLRDYLHNVQLDVAETDLGLPYWDDESPLKEKEIYSKLRSPNKKKLFSFPEMHFVDHDFIVVCASNHADGDTAAAMTPFRNVLELYPCFFSDQYANSLKDVHLMPEVTDMRYSANRVQTLMHEVMHSRSSIHGKPTSANAQEPTNSFPAAKDNCVDYTEEDIQHSNQRFLLRETTWRSHTLEQNLVDRRAVNPGASQPRSDTTSIMGYGLEACLKMALSKNASDINNAQNNADTWATYGELWIILLAYPEFDCMASSFKVKTRDRLIHHCSLYNCMRHPDAPSIWELSGYDPSKDSWAEHTGKKRPANVTELLAIVDGLVK